MRSIVLPGALHAALHHHDHTQVKSRSKKCYDMPREIKIMSTQFIGPTTPGFFFYGKGKPVNSVGNFIICREKTIQNGNDGFLLFSLPCSSYDLNPAV